MYAKITDNNVIEFPVNPMEQNPSTSFPSDWGGGEINGCAYVLVKATEPPAIPIGYILTQNFPVLIDKDWYQSWSLEVMPLEQLKPLLSNYVTEKRYKFEVGGVNINDNIFATDRESQVKYVAISLTLATKDPALFTVEWKTVNNGFVTLNSKDMANVIATVQAHIQDAYKKESQYLKIINDSTDTKIVDINFDEVFK